MPLWGSRGRRQPVEDLPQMDDNIEDSSAEAEDSQVDEDDDSELGSFMDNRDDEEIEAEGAAALAAEQQEDIMSGSSDEDPDGYQSDQPDSPVKLQDKLLEQEDDLRRTWGMVQPKTWFNLYLEFLLLCAVRGARWRQAVLTSENRSEKEVLLCAAAKEFERKLLGWRSQGTVSTWVSAHKTLWKCVTQLPYFTQRRCCVPPMQRCAVCYRHRCTAIKLFVYQGHPLTRSQYIRDDTTGITAPRKGERAKSKAREADIWGDQQFGGSESDTGSSTDDGDCLEADWGRQEWKTALRCDRYATRRARRQRRHDRKRLDRAALAEAQKTGWAWMGWIPPEFCDRGEVDELLEDEQAGSQNSTGNNSSSRGRGDDVGSDSETDEGSSSDEAPISQRRWAHAGTPGTRRTAAAAAGGGDGARRAVRAKGGSMRRSGSTHSRQRRRPARRQRQRQQDDSSDADSDAESESGSLGDEGDEEEEEEEAVTPAAAAEGAGSRLGRYNTRGSAGRPKETQSPAVKRALALAASKRGIAKQLDFGGAAAGGSPAAKSAAAGAGRQAGAAAAAAAAAAAIEISSTESESDGETLAVRQQRHQPTPGGSMRKLKHTASNQAAAAAPGRPSFPSAAAAVDELADDMVDLTHATPKKQRRSSRAQCILSDEEADSDVVMATASLAARKPAAAAAAGGGCLKPAAAAAAAAAERGEVAGTVVTPGKRSRHQRAIVDSDDDSLGAPAAHQQRHAAAGGAGRAGLQSPLKKQRQGAAAAAAGGSRQGHHNQQQQRRRRLQRQQQQVSDDDEVVDLCDTQPTDELQDSQQQQPESGYEEEEEEEERPFRRRGFRVGGGVCAARLRLHHLLHHWPYKATLLLKDAYELAKVHSPNSSQQQWIEEAQSKVAKLLWDDAYEGIETALQHLVQMDGRDDPRSAEEVKRRQEAFELIEAAEKALDQNHESTFRWQWA